MNTLPDFPSFFRALWTHEPFPWQARLASELTHNPWPSWITLPTGTGKTSVIDIAVYHLATQATVPAAQRKAPVRIVFAVNRRIVVDEAFERARKIAGKLQEALSCPNNPLHPFASALQTLSGSDEGAPLEVYPLRGATFTDHSWARTPTQPIVITTTLDQLGSRLLFRGYGVSEFARPLHAALLANDSLLILDEAHTSKAFSQTLNSIESLRTNAFDPLHLPFKAIQLTATPPTDASDLFTLNDDDTDNPVINARLNASKPVECITVLGAIKARRHSAIADSISEKITAYLGSGARRILIVVNRVATAQELYSKLSNAKEKAKHGASVELLTGRLRPLDRDELIKRIVVRHELQSTQPAADVPTLILIATQCIEVGSDLDFDALLTELAPLDSLRQRFGRLNRYGRPICAISAIFAAEESLDTAKPDTLYGTSLPKVWSWLSSLQSPVGFGIMEIAPHIPTGEHLSELLSPTPNAPILLPSHLDLLCQTSPAPHLDPEPSFYIHGQGRDFPEVTVVLRADLEIEALALETLRSTPPLGTEGASVPLHLARAWITDSSKIRDDSGDISACSIEPALRMAEGVQNRCYRWAGGEPLPISKSEDLCNGDVLILPTSLDFAILAKLLPLPAEKPWQLDQLEFAHLLSRDRLLIRLHPSICSELEHLLPADQAALFRGLLSPLNQPTQDAEKLDFPEKNWILTLIAVAKILAEKLPEKHCWKILWKQVARFSTPQDWKAAPHPQGGALFQNRTRVGYTSWPLDPQNLGFQSQDTDEKTLLCDHVEGVANRANGYSRILGLPAPFQKALEDAALWHDLGKLDPRFQAWLHGCSLWAVGSKPPIAKSGGFRPQAVNQFLRDQAGVPQGFRHELLSTLIVAQSHAGNAHPNRDLILHLIASHHGRCRAFAPVISDPQPEPFEIVIGEESIRFAGLDCPLAHMSSGVVARFWNLTRRFGWWGLPYLEALLRLADQQESAKPSVPSSI